MRGKAVGLAQILYRYISGIQSQGTVRLKVMPNNIRLTFNIFNMFKSGVCGAERDTRREEERQGESIETDLKAGNGLGSWK